MKKQREQELLKQLGDSLRERILSKGWTLESLANEAEIEVSQVHRIEKGKINPKYTTLHLLAEALGTTIGELLKAL